MNDLCDDALANLYLYLDRELDTASSERIRDHLIDCPPCSKAYHFETRLKQVVRDRLREEVPPAVLDRLRSVLDQERSRS